LRYGFKGENPTSKQFQNMSVQNILNGEQRTIIVIAVAVHTEENIFSDDEANEINRNEKMVESKSGEISITAYKYILMT